MLRGRKIFLIFFSILALTAMTGLSQSKKTFKIGFIGPLTGDSANYGKLMTQAIRIAVDERNAAGGIGGIKVTFIPEDDEGKVEKANAAIEKLASVDKVYGIVGAVFSSSALAIAPKAQAEKIVMITPSSTHKALTSKGSFIFRNVLSDQMQAIVFAKYVYEKMGLRRIAILYLKNDYSQGLAEDFKKEFEAQGGKITAMESGMQGDKDFKTQLTKIRGTIPEALYLPDYIAEMAQILEESHQLGLQVKFISSDGFSNPEIFDLAGKFADGVVFANSAEEKANSLRSSFEMKYEKRWGQKPDSFSLNSYDAVNLIMDALAKVYQESTPREKSDLQLNREKIRAAVAGTENYEGVSGNITFLPSRDALKNVGIFEAKNGQYIQIGSFKIKNGKLAEAK